jgi:FkbM family methyltransferase
MIIQSFKKRFEVLKKQGINIQYVLDIGAYRGDFTETIHSVWPTSIVKQFEADERQKEYLNSTAIFCVLGDEEREVEFYTLNKTSITTGSSVYKEMTPFYSDKNIIVIKKNMVTLDILDEKFNFYGNWKEQGLIKIDTQGSELIILQGASIFLEKRKPKFILLECPIQEYNQGAPKLVEYISIMHKMNYIVKDIYDLSYDSKDNLLQIDVLFERQ